MIETIIDKVVKPDTRVMKFWNNIDESTELAIPDKSKHEKAIASFWDAIVGNDGIIVEVDKAEQIDKLRREYIDNLKTNSEYPDTIKDDGAVYEKLTPEETSDKRAEFNTNKERLIKEWKDENGIEWPHYKEDVYVNDKLVRKAGDRYDAHHVNPLSFGGKNEANNISPIHAEKHFDKQGVHAPDSPYGKLERALQGVKA
jgi:hypothetical protein